MPPWMIGCSMLNSSVMRVFMSLLPACCRRLLRRLGRSSTIEPACSPNQAKGWRVTSQQPQVLTSKDADLCTADCCSPPSCSPELQERTSGKRRGHEVIRCKDEVAERSGLHPGHWPTSDIDGKGPPYPLPVQARLV